MITRILLTLTVCLLLFSNTSAQLNTQKALSRRTENYIYKDGKRIIKAYRLETVVYDDQGREFIIPGAHKGKVKEPQNLKPGSGEKWVLIETNHKVHRATVEVKDVDDLSAMPLSAPSRWAANSTVCISINDEFTDEQKEAIYQASEAWNVGIVKFVRSGPCDSEITVERYPVLAERKGTAAATLQESRDGVLISARILIDPATQKINALRSLVAHEIGHSLGLLDSKGKSVMRPFRGPNKDNGHFGPSEVDLNLLRGMMVRR